VEYLSVPLSHFFLGGDNIFNILKSLSIEGRFYFLKQLKVILSQIRALRWVFHFNNQFLGQKLIGRVPCD
jgi:hypothetical protein